MRLPWRISTGLTPLNAGQSLHYLLQKPVFYHLWFFFAIILIYLLSPLIQVRSVQAGYLVMVTLILVVFANPDNVDRSVGALHWLPLNLWLSGDSIYYVLYALFGRAVGMPDTSRQGVSWLAGGVFVVRVAVIAVGTRQQMAINGAFADT